MYRLFEVFIKNFSKRAVQRNLLTSVNYRVSKKKTMKIFGAEHQRPDLSSISKYGGMRIWGSNNFLALLHPSSEHDCIYDKLL